MNSDCPLHQARMFANRHILLLGGALGVAIYFQQSNTAMRNRLIFALAALIVSYTLSYYYAGFSKGPWSSQFYDSYGAGDPDLAKALLKFFQVRPEESVLDLGCGNGSYLSFFRENGLTRLAGYDGNDESAKRRPDLIKLADLSQPLRYESDWVMSLEVGEHIPASKESVFMDNLTKNARKGLILSWAQPGQGGNGHVNELSEASVRTKIAKLGFTVDEETTKQMRGASSFYWFRHNLLVFRRSK